MNRDPETTVTSEALVWDIFFGPHTAPPRSYSCDTIIHAADIGVVWVSPRIPIQYEFIVNGVQLGPPHRATGGLLVRQVELREGLNRLGWSIRYGRPGWRYAVYLRADQKVTKLCEGQGFAKKDGVVSEMSGLRVRVPW